MVVGWVEEAPQVEQPVGKRPVLQSKKVSEFNYLISYIKGIWDIIGSN